MVQVTTPAIETSTLPVLGSVLTGVTSVDYLVVAGGGGGGDDSNTGAGCGGGGLEDLEQEHFICDC